MSTEEHERDQREGTAQRPFTGKVRRRVLFLTLASGVLIAALWAASFVLLQEESPAFNGTVIDPPMEAAGFTLQDQRGETFRLSEARGKVAVLTFLYTSCADVCPFISAKFRMALDLLENEEQGVEFVAITSDPQRDTRERVAEYSRQFGLYDRWRYLIGPREELMPVWNAYFVGEPIIAEEQVWASQKDLQFYGLLRGLDDASINDANLARAKFGGGYDVGHGAPVWLIDQSGRIRVKLGQDLAPEELVQDIRRLLD